jgi:hypothetical protein
LLYRSGDWDSIGVWEVWEGCGGVIELFPGGGDGGDGEFVYEGDEYLRESGGGFRIEFGWGDWMIW